MRADAARTPRLHVFHFTTPDGGNRLGGRAGASMVGGPLNRRALPLVPVKEGLAMNLRPASRRLAVVGLAAAAVTALASCQPVTPVPPLPTTTTTSTTTAPPPVPVGQPCASSSPAIVCTQFPVGGLTRKVFYHLPSQAAPVAGRPLVLSFHGDGGTGNVNLANLYAQTDPDAALVVQLDGPNNIAALNRGSTAWSFFMNATSPDDVGFTKTVIDDIVNGSLIPGVAIDTHRVYATGVSRGGFMVDTLLVDARTAGMFAGVVNVSGAFYCETGDAVCTNRTNGTGFHTSAPVLHIHGDADAVVAPPAKVPTPVTGTISWPWPLAQFSYANGCSGDYAYSATVIPSIGAKPTYAYKPSGGCAQDDQLVLVKGGGHVPGGWESYGWSFLKTKSRP